MKKIIFSAMLIFAAVTNCQAQNAKLNATGNYEAVKTTAGKETAKLTGKTFTDAKGNAYPLYESKNGKLFYMRVSKTGNEYKCYLKL
jgi:hypothetical protein